MARRSTTTQGGAAAGDPKLTVLAFKDGETPWTAEEYDEVMGDLREHQARITRLLSVLEREVNGLMTDAGDGAGQDQADVGSTTHERDQDLQLLTTERQNLEQVESALARLEAGTFGVCDSCAQPIGKLRAMAFPRATLCLPCKQRQEKYGPR